MACSKLDYKFFVKGSGDTGGNRIRMDFSREYAVYRHCRKSAVPGARITVMPFTGPEGRLFCGIGCLGGYGRLTPGRRSPKMLMQIGTHLGEEGASLSFLSSSMTVMAKLVSSLNAKPALAGS